MNKNVVGRYGNNRGHWVGDGFPVRTLFSYDSLGERASPFLLLDYAGPYDFEATTQRRGVGQHPHRGFETVTVVYDGQVEHKDSAGNGGLIGPGDVQWMTAGAGILHEEYHAPAFARSGGRFRMIQLWVNLPSRDKMAPARYQGIVAADIPVIDLPQGGGKARVIAGELLGAKGPAQTFIPINMWDLQLARNADFTLSLPEGHTAMLVVLAGRVTVNGDEQAGEAEMILLSREGKDIALRTGEEATLLMLTGEPIDEPIVGRGPFVMNTEAEIQQAFDDFRNGRFGKAATARTA
ncbi:pirin family protein [Massilia endophytica]|uniref:pirin family protein n=1 Tax=Massilia endophytica TaxID=2899220 RepID=UPI001E2A776E|nr:pirin family protein [Massilia endophytica]UGQ45933.1 pirin family protein [Massilia endophytica]